MNTPTTQYQRDIIACLPARPSEVASKLKKQPKIIRTQLAHMCNNLKLIDRKEDLDGPQRGGYIYTKLKTYKCSSCGEEKARELFGATRGHCLACRREKRKEVSEEKNAPKFVGNPHANAFMWREFIQPVPMREDKWSNMHKPDTSGKPGFVI